MYIFYCPSFCFTSVSTSVCVAFYFLVCVYSEISLTLYVSHKHTKTLIISALLHLTPPLCSQGATSAFVFIAFSCDIILCEDTMTHTHALSSDLKKNIIKTENWKMNKE